MSDDGPPGLADFLERERAARYYELYEEGFNVNETITFVVQYHEANGWTNEGAYDTAEAAVERATSLIRIGSIGGVTHARVIRLAETVIETIYGERV